MITQSPFRIVLPVILLANVSIVNASDAIKRINPAHLPDSTKYGYAQAVKVNSDATHLYVSGQVGVSENGANDFYAQVDRAFDNLNALLLAGGSRTENIIKITLLVKNIDEQKLQYLAKKRRAVFGDYKPASILIPVPALAFPSLEFEIDAIAVVDQ